MDFHLFLLKKTAKITKIACKGKKLTSISYNKYRGSYNGPPFVWNDGYYQDIFVL